MKILKQQLQELVKKEVGKSLNEVLSKTAKIAKKLLRFDKALRDKNIILSHGKAFHAINDLDMAPEEASEEDVEKVLALMINNGNKEIQKYNKILQQLHDMLRDVREEMSSRSRIM